MGLGLPQQSSNLFEGLVFLLACSVHFLRRRFGRLLWDSLEIAQNRRRTKCTEHASTKIRPSKRLALYIFQIVRASFCGSEKILQNSCQISCKSSLQKKKIKISRRASAEMQGDQKLAETERERRNVNGGSAPRDGTQGAEPGSGVQRFWGPLGASEFDSLFRQFEGLGSPLPGAP